MGAPDQSEDVASLDAKPVALALSGGGLRAALFQQGCFLALAMRQELSAIKHVSAISGGTLAALVLRQAHADVAALPTPPSSELDHQLALVFHAERHLSRLASRNIRSRALLSWKSVASAVLFGALNLTRRFAEDINSAIGRFPRLVSEPFTLRIGVHDLVKRRAGSVVVDSRSDVGVLAAAAMSIPGMMESLIIDPSMGPVCDGGVDDKTALQILRDSAPIDEGILVLDASTDVAIDPRKVATPMASLMALMEGNSEVLRASQSAGSAKVLGWVSLRDAHAVGCDFDLKLLGFLQRARTDLNHFSAVEQLALASAGFIVTLHTRGETKAQILERALFLQTIEVSTKKGSQTYPLAKLFEGVCRALLKEEQVERPATFWGKLRSWGRAPIADGLAVILEKSSRSVGHDVRSKHSFIFAMGMLASVWGLMVALSALLMPLIPLWVAIVNVDHATHVSQRTSSELLWLAIGTLATAVSFAWARAPGAVSSTWRVVVGVVSLPALLLVTAAARIALFTVHEGEGGWSLRYKQSTLGRVRGLVSVRDLPPKVRAKPLTMIFMLGVLVVFGVFNPWMLAYWISPHLTDKVWNLDALGWVGNMFKYSPFQPITLGILALDWITSAAFGLAGWLQRVGAWVRSFRLFRFQ